MEGRKVLERLVQEGRLDAREAERWIAQAQRSNENPLDLVLEANALSEPELLKSAAAFYQTQFVGTDKLVKVPIERAVLEMVPIRLVERFVALPILLDRKSQTLSVVVADLDQLDVDKQIALVAGVRQVKCYVGRPRTVRALIRRWYYGDPKPLQALLDASRSMLRPSAPQYDSAPRQEDYGFVADDVRSEPERPVTTGRMPAPVSIDLPGFAPPPPKPAAPLPSDFEDIPGLEPAPPVRTTPAVMPAPAIVMPTFTLPAVTLGAEVAERASHEPVEAQDVAPKESLASSAMLLETTSVLVALLEQDREELRGHSAQVARLTRKVLERIGVGEAQAAAVGLAAQLHDVGKASSYHLTALNVAQYEGHKTQAQKSYLAPCRLFESAALPRDTLASLTHLYERFDGTGFPDRLNGRDIPLGARVLAAVESYVDVTTTTRNPYRRTLAPKEACDALARFKGQVFDPTVLDLVRLLVLGDDLDRKLDADRKRVLVVDPDPEETTVLEMRLAEHGYDTVVARAAEAALAKLAESSFDLLVSEVDLPGTDGFGFLQRVRSGSHGDVPVLVVTRRSDRESVERGFALGVADYLIKPASADVVAAKIRLALASAKPAAAAPVRGVTGQLSEMSLPDVVQIFSNGRRTGRMIVRSAGMTGELHFRDGMVYDATYGASERAEAVYEMLALVDGEFSLDSSFTPEINKINASSESLLLEGMRRLDELRR